MGTAFERAAEFLLIIESTARGAGIDLPEVRYTTMGDAGAQYEAVIVAVASIGPYLDLTGRLGMERCGPPQTATIQATIARDWVCVTDDGTDDPEAIMLASAVMQADADVLWDCVFSIEPYLGPSSVNITTQITGGLVAVSAVYTIGIH